MIHSSADMPTRGTDSSGHSANNFDFVRFVAASLVLYSHCFALTGYGGDEPLVHWTRGEYAFGGLAVRVFFVISGFLVTTSWLRKPNVIAFAAARCLRIFPALAVALVYCIALGALATTLPLADFLLHPQTIGYFWHNLVLQTEFFLPGGVFHANPNPDAVNGSIWSLYYEVRAYLVVLVLGMLGLTRSRWYGTAAWIAAAAVMFVYRPAWGMWVKDDWPVVNAYFCFIGGALVALHPRSLRFLGVPALVAAALVPFCIGTPLSGTAMDVLLVTGTLWVAHRRTPVVARFGRYGDFSYGIFIYAFPTQQLIAWSGLVHGPYAMLALAFPATLALAVFSWHCIERPCRDLKRYFRRTPAQPAALTQPGGP